MTKIDKLLSVLIMPEEQKAKWFYHHGFKIDSEKGFAYKLQTNIDDLGNKVEKGFIYKIDYEKLPAIAFKLRNEAVKKRLMCWQSAIDKVFLFIYKNEGWAEGMHTFERWPAVTFYFSHKAQPSHYIIAAIIAEEIEKLNKKGKR